MLRVPYACQSGVMPSAKAPCTPLSSQIQRRRTHCSLATLAQDVKKHLLPTLKVPSSFSQYVSQDGGPNICTLLIVPSLHHIPLYLLFFQVIYIYILSLNHCSAKVSSSRPKSSDQRSQWESFYWLQWTQDHKVLNPQTSARSGGIPIWIQMGHQPLRPILIHKSTYPTDILFSGSPPIC